MPWDRPVGGATTHPPRQDTRLKPAERRASLSRRRLAGTRRAGRAWPDRAIYPGRVKLARTGEATAPCPRIPLETVDDGFGVTADIHRIGRRHAGRATDGGTVGVVPRSGLLRLLCGPARVAVVSAPAGSGKTVLLRSWISETALAQRAAWVEGRDEPDPRQFWLSALGALRRTGPGSALVRPLTTAPDLDGWALVERLLKDLAPLEDRLWLVIDDVHELSPEALRQLELLVLRAPTELRFVLASRHDVRLGLHRLRLEGELAEIRAADLRFTGAEARELFAAAGVELPEAALAGLLERTEGWVAGLRLAALSLAGHPDPERFAEEFSGSERTVAEYLLAEVLDRRPEEVRRLLLRTSILERVNGELADLLTGDDDGERILQDLEQANAFVVSLDAARTWFRYHQMFAGLLALELRRTAPRDVTRLHQAASSWFAAHQFPVEAIRHAQAARDWELAARLFADHWPGLFLDGRAEVIRELLAGYPPGVRAADAELAAITATDELAHGSVAVAEWYLGLAESGTASVPAARIGQAQLLLSVARLLLARQRGDPPAGAEAARQLQATADARDAARPGHGDDLHALALTRLRSAEYYSARFDEAADLLDQGIALARRIERPFLEFTGLAHLAAVEVFLSHERAAHHATRAVDMAERHDWTDDHAAGIASVVLGVVLASRGRLEESEPWVRRAERAVRAEAQPIAGMWVCLNRALLELGRGRNAEALAAVRTVERLAGLIAAPGPVIMVMRAFQAQILALLGETGHAEDVLAGLAEQGRERGEIRIATAGLRLAQDDPNAAAAALAPVLDGSAPLIWPNWLVQAFLLQAIIQDALGDQAAADRALERALDQAEPDGALLPFLLYPAAGLLERNARHHTSHAALIDEIEGLLAGPGRDEGTAGGHGGLVPHARGTVPPGPAEALSTSELRVLRYLPTNLTAPEIASELSISRHTVKTHMRKVYAKLGTHRRAETVARARDLRLLTSGGHRVPRTESSQS
jgi:LuxR family transcriptional regulator, maltose regulon positive regulatory protein